MSLIFYVKSILENLEVRNLPFWAFLETLNLDDLSHFSLQKVQKIRNNQVCKIANATDFALAIPKIDFTYKSEWQENLEISTLHCARCDRRKIREITECYENKKTVFRQIKWQLLGHTIAN